MERISGNMHKVLKEFLKRKTRGYRRLYGSGRRRRMDTEELGGGTSTTTGTQRRRWRIKISRKIKIPKIPSPKKMMLWLRDAYVRMMVNLADSKVMSMSASATGNGGIGGFGRVPPPQEYDDEMLVHMYKSLVAAQGVLVPRHDACPRHPSSSLMKQEENKESHHIQQSSGKTWNVDGYLPFFII